MITFEDIKFSYPGGGFSLQISGLAIPEGKNTAIIGPSGSGKTTLLNIISGALTPLSGSVNVNGTQVSRLSENERRAFRIKNIGYIFQDFALIEYLNVLDNIIHPYRISRTMKLNKEVISRAKDLAVEMGISDKLSRFPHELSHGEKQRVAICRALVTEPKIILADEATGNLDPENKHKILDALFSAVENRHAALISVTHDHELLERFDHIVNFEDLEIRKAA